ncbi:hypothetical protein PTKIN_Ptkin12aG0116000 [Pterospermum kingtungense]
MLRKPLNRHELVQQDVKQVICSVCDTEQLTFGMEHAFSSFIWLYGPITGLVVGDVSIKDLKMLKKGKWQLDCSSYLELVIGSA